MDLLFPNMQKRNHAEIHDYSSRSTAMQAFLGNDSTLTEDQVTTIPAVQASLELITSAVGQLPVKLYIPDDGGIPRVNTDDSRLSIINRETNEELTGYSFKKKVTRDFLLYGVSKSVISYENATSNIVKAIYPLDTNDLTIEVHSKDGYKRWGKVILTNNSGAFYYSDDALLSVLKDTNDGITGNGILHANSDVLHLALSQIEYERALMENGATPMSVLQTDSKLTDDVLTRLMNSWTKRFSGPNKAGRTVVLEQGLKYNQTSINPDNLQLDSSKKSVLSDIARMFNLPESLINSNANKYNSNEQNNLFFLQNCLSPILVAIEAAFNKMLLSEEEKVKGVAFKFDTTELLKTTVKEKIDATATAFDHGLMTFTEAREQLGYPNIEVKDFLKLSLGSVLLHYEDNTMDIPNIGVTGENSSAMSTGKPADGSSSKQLDTQHGASKKIPYNEANEMQSHEHAYGSDNFGN